MAGSDGTLSKAEEALEKSNLADQIELVKLTPQTMNTEEISKLWTAMQASYRPSGPSPAGGSSGSRMMPNNWKVLITDWVWKSIDIEKSILEPLGAQVVMSPGRDAATLLGRMGTESGPAIPALIAALKDEDECVRRQMPHRPRTWLKPRKCSREHPQ